MGRPKGKQAGQSIKNLRLANGLTQVQFGELVGLDQKTIQDFESGRRGVSNSVQFWSLVIENRGAKLARGDLEPLREDLGIKEGSENRQQAEESQNQSRGNDSRGAVRHPFVSPQDKLTMLQDYMAEPPAEDEDLNHSSIHVAMQLAFRDNYTSVGQRHSPRQMILALSGRLLKTSDEADADDLCYTIAFLDNKYRLLHDQTLALVKEVFGSAEASE